MGACLSTSSCTRGGRCDGEIGFCVQSNAERDGLVTLKHLNSIRNSSSRILTNGKSRSCCLFTQQGLKGINQDAMVVWEDFLSQHVTFCGIFDGHGPQGHLVARKVRDSLPINLLSFLQSRLKGSAATTSCFRGPSKRLDTVNAAECHDSSQHKLITSQWNEAFLKSYKAMDKELRSHPNLDCFCSGCTAVTIIKQGSNLFMGYIGDSRAVMGSKDGDSVSAVQLTVDLKPDLPTEAERIKRCKGRVFAMQDEPQVSRVWLPFDDAPGLAMARAFGDFCLKEYGVISVPEVSHRILTDKDQFIVLASDGVWDVLSNEEVVEIVSLAPARSSAARLLVDAAAREWKLKYPTSKMDDCAVICLFLDGKMDSESDYEEQGFSSAVLHSNTSCNVTNESLNSEPCLWRNFTVRSLKGNEVGGINGDSEAVGSEDQRWSGLEGVTRVNSLVQLPRFSDENLKV